MKLLTILVCKGTCTPVSPPFQRAGGSALVLHPVPASLRPLRVFKNVFQDSSLYLKQLSLFFLLWLISACADRIGYITNFCSMITVARAQNRSC